MANPVPIPYRDLISHESRLATQPWIKWFQFIQGLITTIPVNLDASTTDAWKNDFSQEDFWSNVPGPGASPPASWDIVNAEADHPGIQRLRTDVNNGDITTAFFPVAAAAGSVRWDQISTVTLNFKTAATITTSRFECGISDDARSNWPATAFEFGANMVYAFYDTAVDGNLHFRLRSGGVLRQDLTVLTPCPTDTWLKFVFQRRLIGTAYVMDVSYAVTNGTLIPLTTVSANLPADSVAFGGTFKIGTRVAAARDLYVDRFLMPIPNSPPLDR